MLRDNATDIHLSLIMPAYNEGFRIEASLEAADEYLRSLGRPYEIIVVEDGSTDDTLSIVERVAKRYPAIWPISYGSNRGKGYAVRQGMIASRGAFAAFSDVDLSAPLEELDKLLKAMNKGFDIAIGSRGVRGAQLTTRQPLYREFGGKALNLIIQALAVPGIWDTQCGFKLFRGDVARDVFSKAFLDGWGFDVEVLYLARKMGYRVAEVPVKWGHGENSKIRPVQAALQVIRDIIRMRLHNYGV